MEGNANGAGNGLGNSDPYTVADLLRSAAATGSLGGGAPQDLQMFTPSHPGATASGNGINLAAARYADLLSRTAVNRGGQVPNLFGTAAASARLAAATVGSGVGGHQYNPSLSVDFSARLRAQQMFAAEQAATQQARDLQLLRTGRLRQQMQMQLGAPGNHAAPAMTDDLARVLILQQHQQQQYREQSTLELMIERQRHLQGLTGASSAAFPPFGIADTLTHEVLNRGMIPSPRLSTFSAASRPPTAYADHASLIASLDKVIESAVESQPVQTMATGAFHGVVQAQVAASASSARPPVKTPAARLEELQRKRPAVTQVAVTNTNVLAFMTIDRKRSASSLVVGEAANAHDAANIMTTTLAVDGMASSLARLPSPTSTKSSSSSPPPRKKAKTTTLPHSRVTGPSNRSTSDERYVIPHFTQREHKPLGVDEDNNWLSSFQCYARAEMMEVFQASPADVIVRSTSKSINLSQVGVRCRFCAHLPHGARANRSSAFPSRLKNSLYQSFNMMVRDHFSRCTEIPDEVQNAYLDRKGTNSQGACDSRHYWHFAAQKLGMVEADVTGGGIIMTEATIAAGNAMPPYGTTEIEQTALQSTADKPEANGSQLRRPEDASKTSPFVYELMSHVRMVGLLDSERVGKRKTLPLSLEGFGCRYCYRVGRLGFSRCYPLRRRGLAAQVYDMYHHLQRCTLCPGTVKQQLCLLAKDERRQKRHAAGNGEDHSSDDDHDDHEVGKPKSKRAPTLDDRLDAEYLDLMWGRMGRTVDLTTS